MNSIPVLRSKLIMPELSDSFLMTYRQKTLHNNMDSCRAVTICAPAGYGKTTLAISYFKYQTAASSKVCWYRSDPEDINLPIFASHLTHAIFQSDTIFPVDNASSAICSEAWIRHHQASDIRTYIVLDDFHNVAGNQNICDMIRYLLENLPPSFSIFLLNRGNISVFTEKQKLEKKILKIGLRELSFTNAEIEEIIRSIGRPPLDKKLSDIIARRAEGWIAGIILLFQSVKGKTPDDESVYINKLTHEDALFKYLSMEVLKSIEATTQDSLSKLALLQDFTAAEAQEILKIENAKSVMDQCIGFGMFIQRIPGDPVVYRFHSLFREFLLYILHGRYTEEHIDGLHLDAAKYYINHSVLMRAAEHISKCKDPNAALDLVINAGFNKFLIGERAQLKIWLDLLPDKIINLSPILLMYKAQLMPNNRQQEMVRPLQKAIKQSLADNNPEVYFNLSSVLIYILFCSNNMKGLLEMTSGTSHLLSSASEQMKNALGLLTMAKHIAEENYSMAEIQSENTKYALLPEDSQWLYLILSSIIYICLGKLTCAEESMRKAIVLYNFKNVEPAKGFILHYLTTALCLKNQINELPPYINEIVNIGNKYDYDFLSAGGRLFSAYEKYLSSDTETAIKMLDSAVFHYSQINNKAMATLAKMLRLLWSVRNGRVSQHFNEAQDSFNLLECLCPGLMITEITESILGAIARESREFHIAESCLLSAIKAAREKRAYQVLCGSLFHIAELYFSTNDTVQGHSYLKEAIEFSSCNRYFMFWDIHIPTLVEMASRSIRYGYCTHYAEELLCKFYSANTVSYLSEKIKSIDETQIKAFIDVFIAKYNNNGYENLYFVKATLFGKPQISINGMQIPDTDWNTKKVKGLLDYLLLNSGKT
ncbi:MAG: hypothetical protein PHG58_07520, partial [Clostridia bacterium]|nr:hypothetical protein [Clostridia bacterium]